MGIYIIEPNTYYIGTLQMIKYYIIFKILSFCTFLMSFKFVACSVNYTRSIGDI